MNNPVNITQQGDFEFIYLFSMYYIQHCFICRPSDSTVSEDAGMDPRTVPTLASDALTMQLLTGAEHFGNVIFRYSELPSQYHIDASIDVNRPRQDCEIMCVL